MDYIKFWLAKAAVDIGMTLLVIVLIFIVAIVLTICDSIKRKNK